MRHWPGSKPNWVVLAFVTALVVGTALRLLGLDWGFPERLNTDEWVIPNGALDLAQRNSFEPSIFSRPDHVEIQLSYLAYQLYSHLIVHTPVEIAFAADPSAFLFISRLITVAFGVMMIVLAFLIGKRVNAAVGATSAVLFAIFPPFITHSHYATPDVPITAALMAVVLACMHYLQRPRLASLLMASAATSVAIAIKYPGAIATLVIALVIVFAAARDKSLKRMFTHGAAAIGGVILFLFMISPVLFTNVQEVFAAIKRESRSEHPGADGLGAGGNLLYYLDLFFTNGGLLLSIAVIIGIIASIKYRLTVLIPVLLGAIFWIALSVVPLHWERWSLPMFITPLVMGAVGLVFSYRFLRARVSSKPVRVVVVAVLGTVIVANLSLSSIARMSSFLVPDTRLAIRPVLDKRGITIDNTVFEGYTPFMVNSPKVIFEEISTVDGSLKAVDENKRFVVTSNCMHDRYFNDDKYVEEQAFYARLDSELELELEFKNTVEHSEPSGLEFLNLARAGTSIGNAMNGGLAGCDIRVFRLPA